MSEGSARRPVDAIRDFLHDEAAGGVVLLLAAAVAVVWANSPWADSYAHLWHTELTIGRGSWAVTENLEGWVNDGLMAVFFFVVGLEIKRELVVGELRDRRAASLPALAAVGGVILPALLFLLIVRGGEAARGWGVPMATDIAFAAGVLAVLGRGFGGGTRLFLLSIAIVDDLIAIAVIAVFYAGAIHAAWLVLAAGMVLVIVMMRRWFASPWAYVLPALLLWFAVLESGVHATVAGVVLGLLTPVGPFRGRDLALDLEHGLHPLSAFAVVPVFALANAGVYLRDGALANAL
ncbi:MAG: Na+/H+ antiporter NhaA, partial [Actinomycetes bacterium]